MMKRAINLNHPQYLWTKEPNLLNPEKRHTVKIGTSADNVYLIQQIDTNLNNEQPTINYKLQTLNNEKKSFEFTATEADRGGYGVSYFFVKHNRFYQFSRCDTSSMDK